MIPLDRVRALLSAATPGPWMAHGASIVTSDFSVGRGHRATDAALSAAAPDLARDVLSLADALATAERERDAALASADLSARAAVDAARELGHVAAAAIARADAADARSTTLLMCGEAAERAATEAHAQHAALAGAVRAEREAERGHAAVRADDASRGRHLRAAEAAVDKARHATDALLSAAPPRSTVDARVVREVIAARAALIAVSSERRDVWTRVDHGQRENAASARLVAAEAALDAALAGCA